MRGEFGVSGPALLLPAGPLEAQWGCFGLCTAGIGLSLRTKVAISLGKFVPVLALTAVFLLFQLNFLLLQPVCFPLALGASLGRAGLCFSLFLPVQWLAECQDVPLAPGRANPLLFVLLLLSYMVCYHPRTSPLSSVQLSLDLLTLVFPLSMVIMPETHF